MAVATKHAPDPSAVYHKAVTGTVTIPERTKEDEADRRTDYIALVRLAELGVIDLDGDVIEPGAVGEQTTAILVAHNTRDISLGKGFTREETADDDGQFLLAELHFNPAIERARDAFQSISHDLTTGNESIQEYSFGFRVLEWEEDRVTVDEALNLQRTIWRLKRIEVFEISQVLRGASINSGTISTKSLKQPVPEAPPPEPEYNSRTWQLALA